MTKRVTKRAAHAIDALSRDRLKPRRAASMTTARKYDNFSKGTGKKAKQLRNANARQLDTGPEFELTGTHILIVIVAVFAAAWSFGLLPDP